jgi:hypothetical protein
MPRKLAAITFLTLDGVMQSPSSPEEDPSNGFTQGGWAANLGTPVGITKVLTKDGVSENPSPHPIMGFSILEADSMEAALDLLRDCPHFKYEGTLEVSEIMQMPS